MEKKTQDGYIAGIVCFLISAVSFLIFFNTKNWDITAQVIAIFGVVFGGLGIGSFWKPNEIGQIAAKILDNLSKNARGSSESKQTQKNTRGSGQVIAHSGSHVEQTIITQQSEDKKKKKSQE